jgi:hypothetical protein
MVPDIPGSLSADTNLIEFDLLQRLGLAFTHGKSLIEDIGARVEACEEKPQAASPKAKSQVAS